MSSAKSIHLLIVEDDEDDFFLLESSLKKTSFNKTIIWAETFNKAKEILKTQSIDLVVVDYRLGVHTGLELVSYINEEYPFTPTILMTGLQALAIDEQALRSGVYDYLVKGQYTSEDIDRSIRYAIEKSNVLRSLKESENKFKNLFENAVEYVFIVDVDLHVMDANKAALKLFEYESKEQIVGESISDYFFPKIFEAEKHSNPSLEIEFILPEQNKKRYCIYNLSVVDEGKRSYQLVLHDITERKSNEQREKLLEKQTLTGKVARVIAHEIKNPLTNIRLSLTELRAILKEKDSTEDPEEFMDIIDRNSNRINMLIEDLLNATRFDSMNIGELYVHELLAETFVLVQDRIKLKEISVEQEVQENILIRGDKEKLSIALLNILVNAVEAISDSNGTLKISASAQGEHVTLTITDNGKGIPPQSLNKLFEPFFTSKQGGTGLGLTASYTIITKHDGSIKVQSQVDQGTSFIITLPLKPAMQTDPALLDQ
ncbi:MAG: multi-sensor signal transduction histidine kinase [Bacteroidetes bacterium]|jgi:PAS domain S-box-containing protein|nr:multi-sensor signal transduction histidine kinase [Bacteroidota bacterium]